MKNLKDMGTLLLAALLFGFGVAIMTFAHFGDPSLLSANEKHKIELVKQYQLEHNGHLPPARR